MNQAWAQSRPVLESGPVLADRVARAARHRQRAAPLCCERDGLTHSGITRAFADALTAELPRLRRFAHALCGNASHADDLVQDCIERALMQAEANRPIARLGPWLRSVLHNLFIDEVRRRKSRGTGVDVQDFANDLALSVPAHGGEVADLIAATARLSDEHRRILVLAGVEALSYREIAEELGTPVGTVMSRLARARAALRAILDPQP